MSDETAGTAPASAPAAPSAPGVGESAAETSASATTGNAPGGGGDAVAAEGQPGATPAEVTAAKFRMLNRDFNDQKHAETVLGSEITRARQTQRELAESKKQLEQLSAELNALRPLIAQSRGPVAGQGAPKESKLPSGPGSFARELAENGELELIAKIFTDPEMGPAHAMYRMAEVMDEKYSKALSSMKEEIQGELSQRDLRSQQHQSVAHAIGASKSLISEYPEFDENNQSEEAVQAQNGIVEILKALPQVPGPDGQMVSMASVWLASNPEQALRWAADTYRRQYGTPVFAQAPGTSGSPSTRAAQAAEAMAAGAAQAPLEGTGVPRQRANGQPETPLERIKRENREVGKNVARSPSGRPLGFEVTPR